MARLLLGVSGGIAAYKALETARLAIKAGHAVRVIQTPTSERFVGRASFEAITGAPVLGGEFEPDPARGAFPGEPLPDHAPISHLALGRARRSVPDRPGQREHDCQAGLRTGRQPPQHGGARGRLPGGDRAGHEPPHVSAPGHPGQPRAAERPRGERSSRRERGTWPPTASTASAGWRSPPRCWRRARSLLTRALAARGACARHRGRNAGADRQRPLHRQPLLGPNGSGAGGRGSAPRRRGNGDRRQHHALPAPSGVRHRPGRLGGRTGGGLRGSQFDSADVLLMAAAVADFRPAQVAQTKLKKDRGTAAGGTRANPRRAQLAGRTARPGSAADRLRRRAW